MDRDGIDAALVLERQGFNLDVQFAVARGETTALFGPSGCGKSTIVNCIAGLERPTRGRLTVGGTLMFESGRRINLAPERRGLGYVFQEGRLFPHMSVHDNLLFGRRRMQGASSGPVPDTVIDLLRLRPLLDRRPRGLSGGERQRVALGRAILANARALLLDEPLAALDAGLKGEILHFIEALRDQLGLTMLYVSHDIREVARIANRMVLIENGRVVAHGTVASLTQSTEHHARFAAVDSGTVLQAQVCGKDMVHQLIELRLAGSVIRVPGFDVAIGRTVGLRIDPQDVAIALQPPTGLSIRNILPGVVRAMIPYGPAQTDVAIACGDTTIWSRVTNRAVHELALAPGLSVHALIKAVAVDRSYR